MESKKLRNFTVNYDLLLHAISHCRISYKFSCDIYSKFIFSNICSQIFKKCKYLLFKIYAKISNEGHG